MITDQPPGSARRRDADGGGEPHPGAVLRVSAAYSWRLLVVGLAIYVVLRLIGDLFTLVVPLSLALLVTALLRPLMIALRRRACPAGWRRSPPCSSPSS